VAKQSILLDPNAQSYSDNEIVGKVNAATAKITRVDAIDGAALGECDSDDLAEGSVHKFDTGVPPATLEDLSDGSTRKAMSSAEKTKLSGVEDGATADQTGEEVRDLIVALDDATRKIVITEPVSTEYKVISVQRDANGKIKVSYDDVVVP
jgi:hypothetical protein